MPELHEYSATALATLIRSGEVSCRQVVEAHLARIDAVNRLVHAITVVLRDSALSSADRADQALRSGSSGMLGPLHGVPFTVKENIDCMGSPTTHGVRALRDALPYLDAPVVTRMKAAGAIPIARTNLSEMGLRVCTDNPLRGRTLNPWNPRLTVGGSSGGDAAAVSLEMTPIGLGNDMGGSLRLPAYCCGVATLKPTSGRVPHAASLEPRDHGMSGQAMLAPGPISRTIADLRLCLGVLAGRDIRDPRSVDAPLVGTPPDEKRAALVTEIPGLTLPDFMLADLRRAGVLLEAAGWEVEEVSPPELDLVNEIWARLLTTDFSVVMPMIRPIVSDALHDHMIRICRRYDPADRSNHWIHVERSRLMRVWSGFFSEYSVVLGPTWARPVWPVDADLDPTSGIPLLEETARFITPGNVLGFPSVALPTGVVDGLPNGIQIYADLWREDLCLAAAEIIESAVRMSRPPVNP